MNFLVRFFLGMVVLAGVASAAGADTRATVQVGFIAVIVILGAIVAYAHVRGE